MVAPTFFKNFTRAKFPFILLFFHRTHVNLVYFTPINSRLSSYTPHNFLLSLQKNNRGFLSETAMGSNQSSASVVRRSVQSLRYIK